MIHYLNALSLTEKLRESMQDSGGDLRYAAIESNLAEYANNCASWHWHAFVEFAWVLEGTVELWTPGGTLSLRPGEGYFVNADVLHLNRMAPGCALARIRVLQFETSLLTPASLLALRYVTPVERCAGLERVPLRPDQPGEAELLRALMDAFDLCAREGDGFELEVVGRLFHIWHLLYETVRPQTREAGPDASGASARLREMLGYLHAHFDEPFSVPAMAGALHLGQREVYRAFKQGLGTTPTLYLLRHRLGHAARMLAETDLSVTEIATRCGFSSPSYFCKAFRGQSGASPRDFRRASRRFDAAYTPTPTRSASART